MSETKKNIANTFIEEKISFGEETSQSFAVYSVFLTTKMYFHYGLISLSLSC